MKYLMSQEWADQLRTKFLPWIEYSGNLGNDVLEIGPGRETPRHTHGGVELTCVLSGAYATETERFDVGDLEEADPEVLHQPRVVSDEPCLCVVALDGQIELDGWLGRLMQPFVKL